MALYQLLWYTYWFAIFWLHFGGLLVRFWWQYSSGNLVIFWWYSGGFMVVFWWYSGGILVVLWWHSGAVLWWYSGGVLMVFWWQSDGILVIFALHDDNSINQIELSRLVTKLLESNGDHSSGALFPLQGPCYDILGHVPRRDSDRTIAPRLRYAWAVFCHQHFFSWKII